MAPDSSEKASLHPLHKHGLRFDSGLLEAMKSVIHPSAGTPEKQIASILDGSAESISTIQKLMGGVPTYPDIEIKIHQTNASDGHYIQIYSFRRARSLQHNGQVAPPSPAILHIHGGGMVSGSIAEFSNGISAKVSSTGVPFFSVEYRLAPKSRHPIPVEDCYTALLWLHEHAKHLNIDPARIGVMGESSGGGLAASLALMARDRALSPPLAKQILIYPMLDDRNTVPIPALEPFATWTVQQNVYGWQSLLDGKAGDDEVSPYAAAARISFLEGLPSTYIDVGGLDIFRDEDLEYAARLSAAGVETELHLYPGVPHGFELFGRNTPVVARAESNRFRAIMGV